MAYVFADMLILLEAKKKKQAFFIILAYSQIGKTDSPVELRLDALTEGQKRQINMIFSSDTEKTEWEKCIMESFANELKNIQNKDIKFEKDLVYFGTQRIDLCNQVEDSKNKLTSLSKSFVTTQTAHFKLDTEIINHERQVEELQKKIKQEKEKKSKLEEEMIFLNKQHENLKTSLNQSLSTIRDKDVLYFETLKNEECAFVATFNEKPSTKDLHESLLQKFPPLPLPKFTSQRQSMSVTTKILPQVPSKSLPPTPPQKTLDTKAPPLPKERRASVMPMQKISPPVTKEKPPPPPKKDK